MFWKTQNTYKWYKQTINAYSMVSLKDGRIFVWGKWENENEKKEKEPIFAK